MSFHPRTPQSPSQVSPATSSDALHTLSSSISTATTLPTPAHSVNGCTSQNDVAMTDESPNKRKRLIDDDGDRDVKKVHLDEHRMGIEDLHLDVGEKYLLCQIPHPEPVPRFTDDLYQMYNLTDLASSVAREKPNGEKNALRSSYKGHMKRLGVAGQFGAAKWNGNENEPSELLNLVFIPEQEWSVLHVHNREIAQGLSSEILAGLDRAMTMAKGPIPKSTWDASVLGDLAPTGAAGKHSSARPTAPNTPLVSTPGAANRPKSQFPPGHDPTRPKRNIKKRGYGDSSFEGYGEGFPDDDGGADGGYSTGEGEGGQKRRKKSPGNASPYPSTLRQQSYGPGMVGA